MANRIYTNVSTKYLREYRGGEVSPRNEKNKYIANQSYRHERSFVFKSDPPGFLDPMAPFARAASIPVSAKNRLYNKIVEAAKGPSGELLTSAVEWESSLGMITKRVTQIGESYKLAKQGKFTKSWEKLSNLKVRSGNIRSGAFKGGRYHKVKGIDPTSVWLEYWMGWAPLLGDIYHAIDVLQRPPPLNNHFSVGIAFEGTPWNNDPGPILKLPYHGQFSELKGRLSAFGNFKITNPNLLIANQLGFVNPALTAWQIVPFSFIIDWFGNLAQVLGSLSNFVGLSLTDTGYAELMTYSYRSEYRRRVLNRDTNQYDVIIESGEGEATDKRRYPSSILMPRLTVELPKLSLTRAATSVSLLFEIFLKK